MAANNEYTIIIILFLIIVYFTLFHKNVETYFDPKINTIKQNLMLVDPEVTKKLNIQAGNVSFTENKKDMYLCLKDKKGKYYPDNMLMYVALHELAHAKSKAVDTAHVGDEFKENFDNYLKRAEEVGVFDPKKGIIYDYCGVTPNTK
jgi:hypothetical protein